MGRPLVLLIIIGLTGCSSGGAPNDPDYKLVAEYLRTHLEDPDFELVRWWEAVDGTQLAAEWKGSDDALDRQLRDLHNIDRADAGLSEISSGEVRDPDPAVAELQKFEAPRLVRIRIGFKNREGSKPPDTRLLLFVISGETVTPASQELTDRFDRKWGAD